MSFFGCLGYELDLKHLVAVEVKEIKAQIEFYKKYREVFQFGTFRRNKNGWQVSDDKVTIAGVFHELVHAAPGWEQLRLQGLDREKTYHLTSLSQAIRVGQFGNLLKHVVPVNIDPNGLLLNVADRNITLKNAVEDVCLSGSALMSGVMLAPLFRGTGYDENQRTYGDFGSDVYIAEEIKE